MKLPLSWWGSLFFLGVADYCVEGSTEGWRNYRAVYGMVQMWVQGRALGPVLIVDRDQRDKEVIFMVPHGSVCYNERINGHLTNC
jgi:hypothetical protein